MFDTVNIIDMQNTENVKYYAYLKIMNNLKKKEKNTSYQSCSFVALVMK